MKVLSTDGLTKLIQLIKSTFLKNTDTVQASTVQLSTVATSGSYNDLSNKPTIPNEVTESTVSGWGFTKNTGTVTSVNNISPVNGNVTISIPAAQVNSDWNATSGLAQILNKPNLATVATSGSYNDLSNKPTIPDVSNLANKDLSNLSTAGQAVIDGKVDTTLSNVSSIDANSAVQTALDGKANTSLSNLDSTGQAIIDGKVSKTGDTMAGVLTIHTGVKDKLIVKDSRIARGTIPSSTQYSQIRYVDKDENPLANIYYRYDTGGDRSLRLTCLSSDGEQTARLHMGFNSSGAKYCTFPNSVCVDGQWIHTDDWLTTAFTMGANTFKQLNLASYIPNDGCDYEVTLTGYANTNTTDGSVVALRGFSGYYSGSETLKYNGFVYLCSTKNQKTSAATYQSSIFTVTMPISATNKYISIYNTAEAVTGNVRVRIVGYRRIGTNS